MKVMKPHVVPLYCQNLFQDIEFMGSGSLFCHRGRFFIVSAAHVTENHEVIIISGIEEPIRLKKPACNLMDILPDKLEGLDIDVIPLDERSVLELENSFQFLDTEKLMTYAFDGADFYKVCGYSIHDNRVDEIDKNLSAGFMCVDVSCDDKAVIYAQSEIIQKDRESYMGFRYDPRRIEHRNTKPKIKSFEGLSGGLIYAFKELRCCGVAGMFFECHSHKPRPTGEWLLYGIKTNKIVDCLNYVI